MNMNNITYKLLICISLMLFNQVSFSQNIEDNEIVRTDLNAIFQNLDKSRIPTGYLRDYAFELIDFDLFNGVNMTDSNYVDATVLEMMLRSISSSAVGTKPFTDASEVLSDLITNQNTIPIGIALYKYNYIREDAINEGLIRFENNKVYDVYSSTGAWQNPYEDKYLFGFAPLAEISRNASVTYSFNGIFTNELISTIQFDSGNGQGYQEVAEGSVKTVTYSSNDVYDLKLRIILSNGEVLLSHSSIIISVPEPRTKVPEDECDLLDTTYQGISVQARLRFAYNTTTNKLSKPFIVAEGFDPLIFDNNEGDYLTEDGSSIFDYHMIPFSAKSEYDFVYIDWENSEYDIMANAALMEKIINYINREKHLNGSSEKNIIVGQSLGGIIARIALRKMEIANKRHETKAYVSHDSPHLGANVPLGVLFAARDFFDWYGTIETQVDIASAFSEDIVNINQYCLNAYNLLNSDAVRQILVNYVGENGVIDNSSHQQFMSVLNELGFPQGDIGSPILNMAICLSGDGTLSYGQNDKLAYFNEDLLTGKYSYWAYLFLTKQWTLARGLGSNRNLNIELDIRPFISYNGLLSKLNVTFNKRLLGFEKSYSILDKTRYAPSSGPKYDIVPSSLYPISSLGLDNTILDSLNVSIAEQFAFIPTASALCLNRGDLSTSDYSQDFYSNPPVLSTDTPFAAIRLSSFPRIHTFGESSVIDDVNWILDNINIQMIMDGSLMPEDGDIYSIRNCTYPIQWFTSDSTVATIDSSGKITVKSSGFINIYAHVDTGAGMRIVSKRVMVGFPSFYLNATKNTFPATPVSYWVQARTASDEFFDFIDAGQLTAHWGVKYSNETQGIWSELSVDSPSGPMATSNVSSTTVSFSGHTSSSSALVTFYIKGPSGESSRCTTSITNSSGGGFNPFPGGGIIINSDGDIIDPSTNEVVLPDTKATSGIYSLFVGENDISITFDHYPSASEIIRSLLNDESFQIELQRMKPWGTEELLIKLIVLRDERDEIVWEVPFSILYKEDF